MEEFTLINKKRDRIKIFKPFEDISKPSPSMLAPIRTTITDALAMSSPSSPYSKTFLK